MMRDLRSQLRAYYGELDAAQSPVEQAEIEAAATAGSRGWSAWTSSPLRLTTSVVAGVACLAVVGVVVLSLLAPRVDDASVTTTLDVSSSTSSTTLAEVADERPIEPNPLVLDVDWTLLEPGTVPFETSHHNGGLAFIDGAYVLPNSSCTGTECVWMTSEDALTWRAESVPVSVPAGSEYWSWVDDGTVWWLEAVTTLTSDASSLRLAVTHYEDGEWVQRTFSLPAGLDVPPSEKLANIEYKALLTCNYNLGLGGSVFDIAFVETSTTNASAPRLMVSDFGGNFEVFKSKGRVHGCTAGVMSATVVSIDSGGLSQYVEGQWRDLPDPAGPDSVSEGKIENGRAFLRTEGGVTWTSADLEEWLPTDLPSDAPLELLNETDFGWMAGNHVSADALHWAPLETPAHMGGGPGYANGVFSIIGDDGSAWIGRSRTVGAADASIVAPPSIVEWGTPNGPLQFGSYPRPSALDVVDVGVEANERLYAVATGQRLFSTSNGIDWVEVPMPEPQRDLEVLDIESDGTTLVVARRSGHRFVGSEPCSQPGDVIRIDSLDPDGTWASSEIRVPIAAEPSIGACHTFFGPSVAVGPAGILVSGSVVGTLPIEAIIAQELGMDVVETMNTVSERDGTLIVVSDDGARSDTIDLAALGLPDSGSEFAERPIAWWSQDGREWTVVDRSAGGMQGHQTVAVATDEGFLVTSDIGLTSEINKDMTWRDVDHTEDTYRWRGEIFVIGSNGLTPRADPDDVVLPRSVASGFRLFFGEFGILGGGGGGYGSDLPAHSKFLFAGDDGAWEIWTPSELESVPGHHVTLVGVGTDFIVFREAETMWVARAAN